MEDPQRAFHGGRTAMISAFAGLTTLARRAGVTDDEITRLHGVFFDGNVLMKAGHNATVLLGLIRTNQGGSPVNRGDRVDVVLDCITEKRAGRYVARVLVRLVDVPHDEGGSNPPPPHPGGYRNVVQRWLGVPCDQTLIGAFAVDAGPIEQPDEPGQLPRTPAERVNPSALIAALENAGWTRVGEWLGSYVRLRWPQVWHRDGTLLVPLDPSAPDFNELMQAAVAELTRAADVGQLAGRVLAEVAQRDGVDAVTPTDPEDPWHGDPDYHHPDRLLIQLLDWLDLKGWLGQLYRGSLVETLNLFAQERREHRPGESAG